MEQSDRDVEVFERIPWDSLQPPPDRRWWVYLAAAAVLMGAVGVSIGRGWSPPVSDGEVPSSTSPTSSPVAMAPAPTAPSPSAPPSTTTSTVWSEADLMAVPRERLEAGAESIATWFVVDRFSRDEGDDGGRSFVEWAGALETVWTSSASARVIVAVRRLAAPTSQAAYRRIPDEAWSVDLDLREEGWVVTDGPAHSDPVDLNVEVDGENLVAWTDPAGLEWQIGEGSGP